MMFLVLSACHWNGLCRRWTWSSLPCRSQLRLKTSLALPPLPACLPKGALLVNIGCGSTVDEMAAAEALQTEHLDGYAAAYPTREARSEAI